MAKESTLLSFIGFCLNLHSGHAHCTEVDRYRKDTQICFYAGKLECEEAFLVFLVTKCGWGHRTCQALLIKKSVGTGNENGDCA